MTSEKVAGMSKCHFQYFHTLLHQGMVHRPRSVMWEHNVCVCVCVSVKLNRLCECWCAFSQIWHPQVFKMYTYVAPSSTLSRWLSAKLCVFMLWYTTLRWQQFGHLNPKWCTGLNWDQISIRWQTQSSLSGLIMWWSVPVICLEGSLCYSHLRN